MDTIGANKAKRIVFTLLTAMMGGTVFKLLGIPIPWLLGPMIIVLLGTTMMKWHYEWPAVMRNSGMIIVSYTIGLSITPTALHEMVRQLPYMLLMTVLLILLSTLIAYTVSKISGIDYRTSLLASIPGGLTQAIALAEETKGVQLSVVTLTQVIRLMTIITATPLLLLTPLFGSVSGSTAHSLGTSQQVATTVYTSEMLPKLMLFAAISIAFAIIGTKIKLPTAYLLGPAIGIAIVQLFGVDGVPLPTSMIHMAQLLIGTYVGMMLKPSQMTNKLRTIGLAIASGLTLVVGALALSALLTALQSVSEATALLSLAPGGMEQMGIIAHEIQADLSMVSGYQIFRTLFISFAVPPLLQFLFRIMAKKEAGRHHHL